MLCIKMELEKINYHACVKALLPQLVEHCAAKRSPNELDRFLAGLGADAVPAVCSVLDELSDAQKNRVVVWLAATHEERMRNAANRRLAELLGGPMIRAGRLIAAEEPDGRMILEAAQVAVDYAALLKSPFASEGAERLGIDNVLLKGAARLAIQMGSHLPPESLEKYCISLLNSDKIRARLMNMLNEAITQAGLEAVPRSISVEDDSVIQLPAQLSSGAHIPGGDSLEKELTDLLITRLHRLRSENRDKGATS